MKGWIVFLHRCLFRLLSGAILLLFLQSGSAEDPNAALLPLDPEAQQ